MLILSTAFEQQLLDRIGIFCRVGQSYRANKYQQELITLSDPVYCAMQAKAVREEAAALNEALQAEKAAKWAADAEAEELQKQLSDTEESLAKERWAEG